jgi:Zinc finger, C2H2 type
MVHTEKSKKAYRCKVCPLVVTFTRSDNLNLHMKRIHGFKKKGLSELVPNSNMYQCDICSSPFVTKSSIRKHVTICYLKSKTEIDWCSNCLKRVSKEGKLCDYCKEKPLKKYFHCKFCDKPLASQKTLKIHEKKRVCRL